MNYVLDKLEVVFEVWGFYVFGVINDEIKIKFCFVNWKKKKKKNEKKEDGKYNVWIWDKIGWFCYLEIIWKCKSFCVCFFLVNVINKFGIGKKCCI